MPDTNPDQLHAYRTTDPAAMAAYRAAHAARATFIEQLRVAAAAIGSNLGALRSYKAFGGPEMVVGLKPDGSGTIPAGWRIVRGRLEPATRGAGSAAARRWLTEHQPSPEVDPRYVLKAHGLAYQSRVGPLANYKIYVPRIGEHDGALWALYHGTPDGDFPGEPSGLTWEERPVAEYQALRAAALAEQEQNLAATTA